MLPRSSTGWTVPLVLGSLQQVFVFPYDPDAFLPRKRPPSSVSSHYCRPGARARDRVPTAYPGGCVRARFANLVLLDGDGFRRAAMHNAPAGATYYFEASYGLSPEFAEFLANHPAQIDGSTATGRVLPSAWISRWGNHRPNNLRKLKLIRNCGLP